MLLPTHAPRFFRWIQGRAARIAIGASTARNQGGPGVVEQARCFVADLPLAPFGTSDVVRFKRALDAATEGMRRVLPGRSGTWGLARKLVNVFLRDCLYTCYLRDKYRLERAERLFEIPLDSITGARIRRETTGRLPPWPGVKHVSPELSVAYQAAAAEIGRKRGVERVHLDAYWWGMRE